MSEDWRVAAVQWEKVAQQAIQRAEAAEAALAEAKDRVRDLCDRLYVEQSSANYWRKRAEADLPAARTEIGVLKIDLHELSVKYTVALDENRNMRDALRAILAEAEEAPPGAADPFTVAIQIIGRHALNEGQCPACGGRGVSNNQPEGCTDCYGTGRATGDYRE